MLAQKDQLLPPDHPVAVVVHVDAAVAASIRRIELPAVGSRTRLAQIKWHACLHAKTRPERCDLRMFDENVWGESLDEALGDRLGDRMSDMKQLNVSLVPAPQRSAPPPKYVEPVHVVKQKLPSPSVPIVDKEEQRHFKTARMDIDDKDQPHVPSFFPAHPEIPQKATSTKWICAACTYENDMSTSPDACCAMCSIPADAEAAEHLMHASEPPRPAGPWTCGTCTFQNSATVWKCSMCDTPKG